MGEAIIARGETVDPKLIPRYEETLKTELITVDTYWEVPKKALVEKGISVRIFGCGASVGGYDTYGGGGGWMNNAIFNNLQRGQTIKISIGMNNGASTFFGSYLSANGGSGISGGSGGGGAVQLSADMSKWLTTPGGKGYQFGGGGQAANYSFQSGGGDGGLWGGGGGGGGHGGKFGGNAGKNGTNISGIIDKLEDGTILVTSGLAGSSKWGAGGGGYGGCGGNGLDISWTAGGGGGGFGANGGNAGWGSSFNMGGGGGGYGGKGADGKEGSSGGGGGYGISNYGAGGGGTAINGKNGKQGICIIQYYAKELV